MAPQTTPTVILAHETKIVSLNDDCIQVDDKVYSAAKLSAVHPGGELFVKAFAGRDASEAFLTYHRRKFPHSKMVDTLVGVTKANKGENEDADFLELCEIIEQVLPRTKSFAPSYYYLKLAFILAGTFGIEFYMHYTKQYKWYLSAILGFFLALVGLNIQHDANHGSISRNPLVNRALGYMQNWIGGSSIDWIHQHVVQHHIETNDVHHDPDLSGSEILRLNPLKPLLGHQITQHIYVFFLILVFGYLMIFTSLEHVVRGVQFTPMSKFVAPHRRFEVFTSLLFIFRWFVLPLYQVPSIYTLINIAPMFVVGGYYLAFFFIISHNFEGVHMFDKDTDPNHTRTFLFKQVSSSCNVGGPMLAFLNGGLNYQIEHHLFPRIQHSHYAKIAPFVRAFCEKKGVPYKHYDTVLENFLSCSRHLYKMGSKEKPLDMN